LRPVLIDWPLPEKTHVVKAPWVFCFVVTGFALSKLAVEGLLQILIGQFAQWRPLCVLLPYKIGLIIIHYKEP